MGCTSFIQPLLQCTQVLATGLIKALQTLRTSGNGSTSLTTPKGKTIENATTTLRISRVVATRALRKEIRRSNMIEVRCAKPPAVKTGCDYRHTLPHTGGLAQQSG